MGLVFRTKLLIEAPVNGGRNYRRMTDCSYVNKLGYMLETPMYPPVLAFKKAVRICEVRTISRKRSYISEWILRDYTPSIYQFIPEVVELEDDDIVRSP